MRKIQEVALICAGPVSQSWLARLPVLMERLGPVKAPNPGVASRAVNALRAGRPVSEYAELDESPILFVHTPETAVAGTLNDLLESPLEWSRRTLVVCNSELDRQALASFELRGAATATLDLLEGFEETRFLAQGCDAALLEIRRLVEDRMRKVLQLGDGRKAFYLAGLTIASSFCTPLIAATVECLRSAGIDSQDATVIAERAFQRSLRAYLKAGRKGWTGPLATRGRASIHQQWELLRTSDPVLADYFLENATLALEYFRHDLPWVSELSELPRRNGTKIQGPVEIEEIEKTLAAATGD